MGCVDSVLNVHRGQVGIAGQIEGGDDGTHTVVTAGGGDVLHPLGAIDLLFQGSGDCSLDGLCAGPHIGAGDRYLRWRQAGKLRDRQAGNHHGTGQNDQQSADCSKNRPSYKEINKHE